VFSSSKFPVGSSDSMIFAFVEIALAIATLCCSPPDKFDGKRLYFSSLISTFIKDSLAFLLHHVYLHHLFSLHKLYFLLKLNFTINEIIRKL